MLGDLVNEGIGQLLPALVPRPLWGLSASRLLPRRSWEAIRKDVLAEASHRCWACGVAREKGLVCHEVWAYDDLGHVATLIALRITCRDCDLVHHIGRAGVVGFGDEALRRMIEVNGITRAEAVDIKDRAMRVWTRRSLNRWEVRVSRDLLRRWPALERLDGQATT